MGKLQGLLNSKYISGTFGMLGHPHYLPTSIFSSGSVPAVLYYSWKNRTNCRDLSFAVGVHVSYRRRFAVCILFVAFPMLFGWNVAAIYGGGVCWGWQERLIDYSVAI